MNTVFTTVFGRTGVRVSARVWGGTVVALFLVAIYALPNTGFAAFIGTEFMRLNAGSRILESAAFSCVCTLVSCLLYAKCILLANKWTQLLWLTLLMYCIFCGISSAGSDASLKVSCATILLGLAVGMFAACFCATTFRCFLALTIVGIIQSIYAIAGYVSKDLVMYSGSIPRAAGTFDQPNDLYTLLLICIFPCLYLMIAFRAKLWMFLPLTICSATFFCVLTLTWTRGAFVALGVGLICFLYPIIKRRRLAAIITIAIITALIFFACVHRSSSFQDKFLAQRSAFSRVTYLKDNLGRIEHNFLLGTGINRDPNASFVGMQTAGAFFSKSLVLSMMVEMGVFGLILFVAAFIGIAGSVASVKGPLLRNSLKATWIVLFAASLFDVPVLCWSRPDGNMLLGFLIGTTLLAVNRSQRPRKLSVIRT